MDSTRFTNSKMKLETSASSSDNSESHDEESSNYECSEGSNDYELKDLMYLNPMNTMTPNSRNFTR